MPVYDAAERRANVKKQLRDRKGRWVEMGGKIKFLVNGAERIGDVVDIDGDYFVTEYEGKNGEKQRARVSARLAEGVGAKASLDKAAAPKATRHKLSMQKHYKNRNLGPDGGPDNEEDRLILDARTDNPYVPASELQKGDKVVATRGFDGVTRYYSPELGGERELRDGQTATVLRNDGTNIEFQDDNLKLTWMTPIKTKQGRDNLVLKKTDELDADAAEARNRGVEGQKAELPAEPESEDLGSARTYRPGQAVAVSNARQKDRPAHAVQPDPNREGNWIVEFEAPRKGEADRASFPAEDVKERDAPDNESVAKRANAAKPDAAPEPDGVSPERRAELDKEIKDLLDEEQDYKDFGEPLAKINAVRRKREALERERDGVKKEEPKADLPEQAPAAPEADDNSVAAEDLDDLPEGAKIHLEGPALEGEIADWEKRDGNWVGTRENGDEFELTSSDMSDYLSRVDPEDIKHTNREGDSESGADAPEVDAAPAEDIVDMPEGEKPLKLNDTVTTSRQLDELPAGSGVYRQEGEVGEPYLKNEDGTWTRVHNPEGDLTSNEMLGSQVTYKVEPGDDAGKKKLRFVPEQNRDDEQKKAARDAEAKRGDEILDEWPAAGGPADPGDPFDERNKPKKSPDFDDRWAAAVEDVTEAPQVGDEVGVQVFGKKGVGQIREVSAEGTDDEQFYVDFEDENGNRDEGWFDRADITGIPDRREAPLEDDGASATPERGYDFTSDPAGPIVEFEDGSFNDILREVNGDDRISFTDDLTMRRKSDGIELRDAPGGGYLVRDKNGSELGKIEPADIKDLDGAIENLKANPNGARIPETQNDPRDRDLTPGDVAPTPVPESAPAAPESPKAPPAGTIEPDTIGYDGDTPYVHDGAGNRMYEGSRVKSTKDGLEGEVVKIEGNGKYVKVRGDDGKIRGRRNTTLETIDDDDAVPAAPVEPEVAPAPEVPSAEPEVEAEAPRAPGWQNENFADLPSGFQVIPDRAGATPEALAALEPGREIRVDIVSANGKPGAFILQKQDDKFWTLEAIDENSERVGKINVAQNNAAEVINAFMSDKPDGSSARVSIAPAGEDANFNNPAKAASVNPLDPPVVNAPPMAPGQIGVDNLGRKYVTAGDGNNVFKGSVVRGKDGFEGEVVTLEGNGLYVKIRGADGKVKGRKLSTLEVLNPEQAQARYNAMTASKVLDPNNPHITDRDPLGLAGEYMEPNKRNYKVVGRANQGVMGITDFIEMKSNQQQVVRKRLKGGFRDNSEVHAEVLSGQLAHRMGMKDIYAVEVTTDDSKMDTVLMPRVQGATAGESGFNFWGNKTDGRYDLENARDIGMLDYLITNHDRHEGNWMVSPDKKKAIPIDHGLAHWTANGGLTSPFSRHFLGTNGRGDFLADRITEYKKADIERYRAALVSMRDQFEERGKMAWYNQAMMKLNMVEERLA